MSEKVKISRNVWLTGLTSFFTDVSSEMVYPLFQAFISTLLATRKALLGPVLGLMEGIAEATASLLKMVAGYYSDRISNRKSLVISGYSFSVLGKAVILLATPLAWFVVLIARFLDRIGKGLRTAPRDALIFESASSDQQGRAFGFQRAMDFAGATVGVLIAFFLVQQFLHINTGRAYDLKPFYLFFALSLIPAVLGIFFLFFIREKVIPKKVNENKTKLNLKLSQFDRNLKLFFLSQAIFTLGNSSNQFLLLRSANLGFSLSLVILQYLLLNLFSAVFSPYFGSLSDRLGRKRVLGSGYCLYAIVYACFGLITARHRSFLWIFWPVYGIYYALTEGVEKAFVAELAPREFKATALGFHHMMVGIGLLPASVIAGLLLNLSPSAPFLFGSGCAFMSVLVLIFGLSLTGKTIDT